MSNSRIVDAPTPKSFEGTGTVINFTARHRKASENLQLRVSPGTVFFKERCLSRKCAVGVFCVALIVTVATLGVRAGTRSQPEPLSSVDQVWESVRGSTSGVDHHHWSVNYTSFDVEHTEPVRVMVCDVGGDLGTVLVPLNSSTFLFNGTLRTSAGSCKEKEGLSELRCDAGLYQGDLCSPESLPQGTCLHEEWLRLEAEGFYESICSGDVRWLTHRAAAPHPQY
jgi:hypothetical protein